MILLAIFVEAGGNGEIGHFLLAILVDAAWVAALIPLSMLLAKELNVQSLGEETAVGLGSRLQMSRMLLLVYCVALAGAAVGVAGTVSFIGLLAPHIARG